MIKKRTLVQKGEEKQVTIDAKGRPVGRVASEAANYLLGKKSRTFVRNEITPVRVSIVNAGGLILTEKKMKQKEYLSYSGYPGGLKTASMSQLIAKKTIKEVLERAVTGMIPRNKLRKERLKRLTISI